jgi:predicted dehydrogenase
MITRREFNKISLAGIVGISSPAILSSAFSPENRIKIGQIGTSHSHADAKLATLRKLKDVFHLVGVVETDEEKLQEAKGKSAYQDVKWLSRDELLSVEKLDAVLVETELNDLVPTAFKVINAGCNVHIDKPPGKSLSQFEHLLKVANNKDLIVQLGYMFRYNPAFRFCLKAVREGWLGDIFEIDGVISKVIKPERRSKLAATYGGGMMLLGCHLIDILIAILGEPDFLKSNRKKTLFDSDDLYDNELVTLTHQNAISTIRSSLVEVEGQYRRQFVVCGTNGTIEIKPLEPPQMQLALETPFGKYKKGYQTINLKKISGRYDDQLIDFARMIKGEKKPDFSMEHDLLVHKILLETVKLSKHEGHEEHEG